MKYAMSALGYAIVLVIILGVVMIISAPMMADKYSKKTPAVQVPDFENSQIRDLENRLTSRIEELEQNQGKSNVSNKYVCTIDGSLDENGTVVPTDSSFATKKFVFVCEYQN